MINELENKMNFIPNKNLYVVTSALRPLTGVWSVEERFKQTLSTIESIRERDKNSIVVISDASCLDIPENEKSILANLCDRYYDLSQNNDVRTLSTQRLQSMAETALLFHTLSYIKNESYLKDCKRIFKISGRSILNDKFDAEEHNKFGKYVFKKRIPTWMNQIHHGADNLLITRMFSLCTSLMDNYLEVLYKNFPILNLMDTEHAHYVNIPKHYLIEFDDIHCWGWISATGKIEHY